MSPPLPAPQTLGTPSHRAVGTNLRKASGLWAPLHHTLAIPFWNGLFTCWPPHWTVNSMRAAVMSSVLIPLCPPRVSSPHAPRPQASYSTELTCHPHPNGACVGQGRACRHYILETKALACVLVASGGKYKLFLAHLAFRTLRLVWGTQLELLFDSISQAPQLRKQLP